METTSSHKEAATMNIAIDLLPVGRLVLPVEEFGPVTKPKPVRTIKQIEADPRVESVSDERDAGEGVWVYLKAGWVSPTMGCGTIHEDTVRDCGYELLTVEATR